MKQIVATAFFFLSVGFSYAQSTEDSVKNAVNLLFTAMKNADSIGLQNSFAPTAVLQTVSSNQEGQTIVRTEPIKDFASSISKLGKGDADERISFTAIHIDGALASVWTPYQFYYKGNFSHCGVNSFQLVRLNGEWKIQHIIDTRRKGDCK